MAALHRMREMCGVRAMREMRGRSMVTAVAALALLAGAGSTRTAAAADDHALYLGFAGGMNVPTTNAEARRDTDQTPEEIYEVFDYNLDHGYSLSGSVGAYIRDFRVEFQIAGQSNDIQSVESLGIKMDLGGELEAMQFMGNVLYDIPLTERVKAFLGAGVGAAEIWLHPDGHLLGDQSGIGFAYQGIAGIAWEIGPGVCVTADYRVWSSSDIEMQDVTVKLPFFHMAEVGVRFSF